MQVKGVIDSIYTKSVNTKRGPAPVYHATIDGQDINLGFKTTHHEGEYVELEVETKFGSLQMIQPSKGGPSAAPTTSPPSGVTSMGRATAFPVDIQSKDMSIIRQNSLTHSREIVNNMITCKVIVIKTEEEYLSKILEIAYLLTDFSSGHRETKQAAELQKIRAV